jgi:hypothetical protein
LFASAAVVAAGIGAGGIATAHGHDERFHVTLRGQFEVPPADPDGKATARVEINLDDGQVCFDLRFDRIGTPTMAHIHGPNGPAGTNAGILVWFFGPGHDPDGGPINPDDLERGRAEGCTHFDKVALADVVENPDDYYVNIHNTRFGSGAVRGQLD